MKNDKKPYVEIIINDDAVPGHIGILHSLEENGVPFRKSSKRGSFAESSALGITVYVKSERIEVYYEKYSETVPVLNIKVREDDTCDKIYQKSRLMGNNIANLINVRRLEKQI